MRKLFARLGASLGALLATTRVQQLLVLAGIVLATLTVAYSSGWRARGTHDRAQAYRTARQRIVDTITVVKKELVHDSVLVHDTKAAMEAAQKRFATSDIRIKIVGDGALSIDDGPAVTTVPAAQVIGEIEAARDMHRTDSIGYRAVVRQLEDETERGGLEHKRADLAEGALRKAAGRKLGFKSGAAVGALMVVGAKLLLGRL